MVSLLTALPQLVTANDLIHVHAAQAYVSNACKKTKFMRSVHASDNTFADLSHGSRTSRRWLVAFIRCLQTASLDVVVWCDNHKVVILALDTVLAKLACTRTTMVRCLDHYNIAHCSFPTGNQTRNVCVLHNKLFAEGATIDPQQLCVIFLCILNKKKLNHYSPINTNNNTASLRKLVGRQNNLISRL